MSTNGTHNQWPTPVPLDRFNLPEFPVDALPDWLARYVQAVSDATQTPTDLAGMISLGVLATCAQRRYVAQVHGEWPEPLSLWVLPMLPSGERKSAVFGRLYQPVYDRQRELLAAGAPDRARALAELASAESALKKAITEAGKGSMIERIEKRAARDEASDEHERLQNEVPPEAILMLDDVTPERLGQVMGEAGAVTIASDEGGVFSTFAGRYSSGVPNLDLLLKSHSGGTASIDRIKRGRTVIEQPACTLAMAVQPDVLAEVVKHSAFVERGGLARFLYAIPQSRLGRRSKESKDIPPAITAAYRERVMRLLPSEPPTQRADQPPKQRVMRLTPEARQHLDAFHDTHEARLDAETGDLAWCSPWASKLPGALVRIAALIQLATHGPSDHVDATSMQQALRFAPYFEAHARAALGIAGESEELQDARKVLAWLRGRKCLEFTEREAYKARLNDDPDRAAPALEELYARHWIAPLQEDELAIPRPGRKPSPRWETHPAIHTSSVECVGKVIGTYKQGSDSLPPSNTVLDSNSIPDKNGAEQEPDQTHLFESTPPEITDTFDTIGTAEAADYYANIDDIGHPN